MVFHSILFDSAEVQNCKSMPEFFMDLNLDQVVQEILKGKEEYNLNEFYYQGLKDTSAVNYRLEVMKEIERPETFKSITEFSGRMKKVRQYITFSSEVHNLYQRQKWFLDAAIMYCQTVNDLHNCLMAADLYSTGLKQFRKWLTLYINSDDFKKLYADTFELKADFDSIRYSVQVERDKITVNPDDIQEDYCETINKTFEQIMEVDYDFPISFFTDFEMCSLENKLTEIVRNMNREVFDQLKRYCEIHEGFTDGTIQNFDREIQFYISYLEYIRKLKLKGYSFAYPEMSSTKKLEVNAGYDLALACKSLETGKSVVPNDFGLSSSERIFILTGPNQGGKTTFARAFGQILFLASIGCPVPCQKAELFLIDGLFTHFSKEEDLSTNSGRLKEELTRLKSVVEGVTPESAVIINELFASTTSYDAYTMGKKVLEHFISKDCICLYVTHIYELSRISEKTVSLVAEVEPNQGSARTYKIFRKPADGRAYANSIVEKYRLNYNQIKERVKI